MCHLDRKMLRVDSLGTSLGGLDIPILEITNINEITNQYDEKPVIVIIGRQHPGET